MVKVVIPEDLSDALELLHNDPYKLLAGGTDLMVQRRNWANTLPTFKENVLLIANIKELDYIKREGMILHIGAMTTLETILMDDEVPLLLKQSVGEMASPGIRNIATIAGNIGNASPAADTLPILYLYDASVIVVSKDNEQIIPIDEFILGPRKIKMTSHEMIKEIRFNLAPFSDETFVKVGGRKADAISKISFAAAIQVTNEEITDLRFTFGAVGPTVVFNKTIEKAYINQPLALLQEQVDAFIEQYKPLITPIDDQRSNKHYRKQVALNLLKDFITKQ